MTSSAAGFPARKSQSSCGVFRTSGMNTPRAALLELDHHEPGRDGTEKADCQSNEFGQHRQRSKRHPDFEASKNKPEPTSFSCVGSAPRSARRVKSLPKHRPHLDRSVHEATRGKLCGQPELTVFVIAPTVEAAGNQERAASAICERERRSAEREIAARIAIVRRRSKNELLWCETRAVALRVPIA